MILLLYAILFCVPLVRASLLSPNDTCLYTLDSSTCSPSNTRTLRGILWSCGLTLFACTWTAVHPNIPAVNDGTIRITFYRLCLMIMALSSPEFLITWSVSQFFIARRAAKHFNGVFGWKLTHGFFACMGGFVLYVNGQPHATLEPEELLRFVSEGFVEMPTITEAEIEDRSKGDGLSKCVAVLQLVWFIVELIARYTHGLPITLLEIDTLGVAAMACIAYAFWWKKPKDIGCPYIVHWISEEIAPPPCGSLYNEYLPGKHRSNVLSIFTDDVDYDRIITLLIIGCVSGMMFGAIHCLGWNYLFQTPKEQLSWRVASVGITFVPLIFAITPPLIQARSLSKLALLSLTFISTSFYILSRVAIIVLMFLSLRSLPPCAYVGVPWTIFIPHVTL
ncbi:hypothetical protein EDD22DRAFT_443078 [Suillus occidentalis]|nr:hypothetical protein EDD22DRAFT_443078 [Suillus occidentalis]